MITITTKITEEVNERLEKLAKLTDRNKSYLLRKAVEFFLHEKEKHLIAIYEMEQKALNKE